MIKEHVFVIFVCGLDILLYNWIHPSHCTVGETFVCIVKSEFEDSQGASCISQFSNTFLPYYGAEICSL